MSSSSSSSSSSSPPWLLQKLFGDPVVPCVGGRVKLTDVNRQLICVLCRGYLVDATSIVECLHSCKLHYIYYYTIEMAFITL
ncbi:polycomb group protein Psc-like [Aphis craccivora]|uniref:Polycomb group protein Psc-like n=1 Tax=Aphis craccivora TaxID=307492 RepID=A0A6G0YVH2_APHCR|nr:polycomb group protein Psc-like [Aphis craccivora]